LFQLGNKYIGQENRAFIVAEIAQAHDGSLGYAHAFIDAAAEAGVDAVKFQAHYAGYESTLDEPFRMKFSFQDKSRYDYWKRMEFSIDQWKVLKDYAESKNLIFLCTPFSRFAVEILEKIGILGWKVGSGEFSENWLLDEIITTKKPIIISTGLSKKDQIEKTYVKLTESQIDFALMHCTSIYPTPIENVNIEKISTFKDKYDVPIGLSDHSGTVWPSIFAIASKADIIEVHLKLSDNAFGPDTSSSLNIKEIKTIVESRDSFYQMHKKVDLPPELDSVLNSNKEIFGRSIALDKDYPIGTCITSEMIIMKKPGTGIPEKELSSILGKKLIKNYDSLFLLKISDIR